ncbi:MAG: glycosyltransferase family 39 protein [Candidatus Omnitrophica bacterium]|nr:glycosyltransferase family 39 protein [Candidatus Omnitrophota bacterium]MDE2010146.1 glycosyltransferase family 39 protein [Candidatus Omnitrophota bacterium]MDE2214879.1 glycosyltransferase family 39 protein [Candidatus Omnitrophota bacterium]MDE2230790.1 glycosyltransferase family 39 protein [Candidatus Omnitrophota bacterium]
MHGNSPFFKQFRLADSFLNSPWAAPAVLFSACLIAYLNSFANNFLLDDHIVLFGQQGVVHKSFFQIFAHDQGGDFYRPVGHLPLWVCSRLFAGHVLGYHIFNFLLFFLIVFLFRKIVWHLSSDKPLAFWAALLYAVHPINGFLVNYVTASIIATFVLCMQGSFLYFVKFSDTAKKSDYALSLILFVLACFSHEIAVTLPVFLMAYLFFMKRGQGLRPAQFVLPYFVFIVFWFMGRMHEAAFHRRLYNIFSLGHIKALALVSTWMNLTGWYLSKLFYPVDILFLWSRKYGLDGFFPHVIVLCVLSAAFLYAFLKWKQGWKPLMLAVFLIGFLPTFLTCFGSMPFVRPFIEPHWFYFSQIGFFVMAALLLKAVIRKNAWIGGGLAAGVVVLLIGCCWNYNAQWKGQETYSRYWLSLNTGNLTPYYGLGRVYMDRGDYSKAAHIFETGYRHLHVLDLDLAADWGHCLDVLGKTQKASDLLYTAKLMGPRSAITEYYIGLYFLKRGRPQLAKQAFQKVMEWYPDNHWNMSLN